jgi:hypothetical protein
MVEKFRYFERQYLQNITITDMAWTTLNFGSMACRATGLYDESNVANPGWEQILPWRESIYLKNQGIGNDNTTDCQIEIFFNAYVINKFKSIGCGTAAIAAATAYGLGYDTVTGLFTLNTGGAFTPTTGATPNHMYLEMMPFGPQDMNISDHSYLNAVLTDVTFVGGNVYTFDIATQVLPYTGAEQIKEMLIRNLTLPYENNRSFHPPTFYQYSTNNPGRNRGIILETGESYSGDLTYDVCVWWRGIASADMGATLVIQQLA